MELFSRSMGSWRCAKRLRHSQGEGSESVAESGAYSLSLRSLPFPLGFACAGAPRRLSPHGWLELDVRAEGRDYYRSAIAVVAGIVDVLQTRVGADPAPDMHGIVGLNNVLGAVI